MAMKIGGEYSSEKLMPGGFERLAEEAGHTRPIVRLCVPELAETVVAALAKVEIVTPALQRLQR